MFRLFAILVLFVSSHASAFSGDLTLSATENTKRQKVENSMGLAMAQPLFFGLSWWSWTGFGVIYQTADNQEWINTTQGLDFEFKKFKLGGTAKFEYRTEFDDVSSEYGVQFSAKLW